jgi:hypothetical protein
VGRALIEGVRNETIVVGRTAPPAFVVRPLGFAEAIEPALRNEDRAFAETRWCDAFGGRSSRLQLGPYGPRIVDSRVAEVACAPARAFEPIRGSAVDVGGTTATPLWRVRGALDLLVGGPGLRRGRRDPHALRPATRSTSGAWRRSSRHAC